MNSFSTTLNVLKVNDVTDNCDVINRNDVAFATDKTNVHGFRPNAVSLNRIKSKKDIKILHLNVASLYSKIDEIRDIVVLSNAHVLSINESLLDSTISDDEVELPGFCIFRNDRNRHGGGVAMYIHQSLSPVRIDIIDNDLESVWVYVASHGKKYIFGSIYRPPSSLSHYWEKLVVQFGDILSRSNNVIILGDFNFNYSVLEDICDKRLREICDTYSLAQLITEPTRVTLHTSNIIDLIFTTVPEKHHISGVIPVTLSDHYMVYTILSQKVPAVSSRHVTKRNYKNFNADDFKRDIAMSNIFSRIFYCKDVLKSWELWLREYIRICNKHAPICIHKVKDFNKPWINSRIRSMMRDHDYWHKKAICTKSNDHFNKYKSLRNIRKEKTPLYY